MRLNTACDVASGRSVRPIRTSVTSTPNSGAWARSRGRGARRDADVGGAFGDEFASLAADLRANEQTIVDELMAAAGTPADVGGYYQPDHAKAEKVMRPSATLNNIIDSHLEGAQQLVA